MPWGSRQPILNLAFLLVPCGPAETPAHPDTNVAAGHAADPVLTTIQRLDHADAMFMDDRHHNGQVQALTVVQVGASERQLPKP